MQEEDEIFTGSEEEAESDTNGDGLPAKSSGGLGAGSDCHASSRKSTGSHFPSAAHLQNNAEAGPGPSSLTNMRKSLPASFSATKSPRRKREESQDQGQQPLDGDDKGSQNLPGSSCEGLIGL